MANLIRALLIVGTLAFFAGCGSGASSPTSPAQIPTAIENYEVEFGAGEVIVTGVVPAGGISSISKSIGKVDATSVSVYGTNVAGTVVSGAINTDDNRFYLKLPAGQAYALTFAEGLTAAAYEDSESGLHSIPTMFLRETAAGTAEFDADGVLVSGDVDVVDVGTISYADSDISVGKTTASGDSGLTAAELGYECSLNGTATNDKGLVPRGVNIDVDGNGVKDSAEGKVYTLKLLYMAGSTENLDSLVTDYADPAKIYNMSYMHEFRGKVSGADIVRAGVPWYMKAPADITYAGTAYPGGSNITSCGDDPGTWAAFFCVGGNSTDTTTPRKPPEGTYIFTGDGNTYTFNDIRTLAFSASTVDDYVPFVIPKLITDGVNITGIYWKWMWKVGGAWTDMTICEVQTAVVSNGDYSGYYFSADLGSGNYKYAGDSTAVSGSLTFTTPVSLASATYLQIQYKDIQGYSHGVSWRNFE